MSPTPVYPLSRGQIESLQNGEVAIFPTETIYGIGCSALCDDSLLRVNEIKGRAPEQPPPILISHTEQLKALVTHIPPAAQELIKKYWPGSLTLILPARPELSPLLCGFSPDSAVRTVGIRHTAHPIACALCEQIGAPMIATSANFSGATGRAAAPQSLADIPQNFKRQVDVIVDGGVLQGVPSTIVDCVSSPTRVLRAGAISLSQEELQALGQL